jgi:hypothetical protein
MQDPYLQDMKYLNELKEIVERGWKAPSATAPEE